MPFLDPLTRKLVAMLEVVEEGMFEGASASHAASHYALLVSLRTANEDGLLSVKQLRGRVKSTVLNAVNPEVSRFHHWPKPLLEEVLAQHGIEVRGARRAPHEYLVKICDEVFEGREAPPPPRSMSLEDIVRLHRAACRIQNIFIQKRASHIDVNFEKLCKLNRRLNHEGVEPDLNDLNSGGSGAASSHRRSTAAIHQKSAAASMISQCKVHGKGNGLTDLNEKESQDEVEAEWHPPSIRYAQKFHLINHPHHSDYSPYSWRKATLGRHCVIGGCGSQLDLWDEGQVSEFGQFGSGITNYFKFLKWGSWIFFILAVASTPSIVINTFGLGSRQYEGASLAVTTIGNLGNLDNHNATIVQIPLCKPDQFQQWEDCTIKKSDLAFFYGMLDVALTIFVILGWLWLKSFEKKERDNLDRATVTASDFTVRIPRIPENTKEHEVAGHFAKLVTNSAVAEVSIAYDNAVSPPRPKLEHHRTPFRSLRSILSLTPTLPLLASFACAGGDRALPSEGLIDEESLSRNSKTTVHLHNDAEVWRNVW